MPSSRLLDVVQSRKFWATVFALCTLAISYQFGHIPLEQAELGVIGSISMYVLSIAVEDHGVAIGNSVIAASNYSPPGGGNVSRV